MVATLKFSKNKMTTKTIFNHIQGLNTKQINEIMQLEGENYYIRQID